MKPGGGKQKGATFERWVCVQLSLWLTRDTKGEGGRRDIFWRSAMSGGRATLALRKGERLARQAGDITAIDPIGLALTGKYMVECKHYASLDLEAFMLRDGGRLATFWRKTKAEAKKHNLLPMLIAKQRGAVLLLVPPGTRYYEGSEAVSYCSRNDCDIFDFGLVLLTVFGHKPTIRQRKLGGAK